MSIRGTMAVARRFQALGPLVAIVIALVGCGEGDTASSSQAGPTDGAAAAAGGSAATPALSDASLAMCGGFGRVAACTACLQKNCCEVATSCARNGDCAKAVDCIRACDGKPASCQQACATGDASSLYNPLVACMYGSCKTACPFASP